MAVMLVATVLVAAACGSSSSSSSGSGSGGGSAGSGGSTSASSASNSGSSGGGSSTGGYNGPEASLPHSYPAPTIKKGFTFTIGWSNPNGTEPSLNLEQQSAAQEATALGGKFIAKDAAASINTQVDQVNQMLAQRVNGLVLYPNDPTALTPQLNKAKAQKIPVAAVSTPGTAGAATLPGYDTNIIQGFDQGAYCTAKAAATAAPGSSFATIGFAAPIPALKYLVQRIQYWGKKDGLKFLGNVDVQTDTPSGAANAMSAILAKYPSVKDVLTWNDGTAEAATTTARSQGKQLNITGENGDATAINMIKGGNLLATFEYNVRELGKDEVIALYDELTHQHLPLAKQSTPIGTCITKANAANVAPD
jgi:ABC-type sugar transport system substrate-binding protein